MKLIFNSLSFFINCLERGVQIKLIYVFFFYFSVKRPKRIVQPSVYIYYEYVSYALNLSNIVIVLDQMGDTTHLTLTRHDNASYEFMRNDLIQANPRHNCLAKNLLPTEMCSYLPASKYTFQLVCFMLLVQT